MNKIAALLGESVSAAWPRTVSRGRRHRAGPAGASEEGDDVEGAGLVMRARTGGGPGQVGVRVWGRLFFCRTKLMVWQETVFP